MAGGVNHRQRIGVLPGLPGSAGSMSLVSSRGRSPMRDTDFNHGKQLVPLGIKETWTPQNTATSLATGRDVISASQLQNFVQRVAVIEESNKSLLEEIYRLQSNARATELSIKGDKSEEKRLQRELMHTIRSSNDVISELTTRMRRAEEKLHIDKESRKNIAAQTKQFEQALASAQQEFVSLRDKQLSQIGELRHKLDDMQRRGDRSDRTSATLIDELRQIKSKLEIQGMDFSHLQAELRQRSKRLEEDTQTALLETRFQKDSNTQSEQNSLQTRQFFEVRVNELRDIISDLRNRIGHIESDSHAQSQQVNLRFSELQSSLNDQSHKRQEDLQSLEQVQHEREHIEENARMKLQERIKMSVEEMSDKLLAKEVRLREEAFQKFIELEKMIHKEESIRTQFEKELREENDVKWSMQQKLMQDEVRAVKEFLRAEKAKQAATNKNTEETVNRLDKKLMKEKKSLEKVLLAEITKREKQSGNILSQVDSVQEQLRVALSSLQQAIGGLQFQVTRDREQLLNDVKAKLGEEHSRVNRALSDTDARLTSLAARITQQDETYEVRINEMSTAFRDRHTEMLRDFEESRKTINKDLKDVHDILNELPQELKETQERVTRLQDDAITRSDMENEGRRRDVEASESKIRMISQKTDTIQAVTEEDHKRVDELQQQVATAQGTLNQLIRTITDVRNSHNVRLNSETKMRLEETSSVKKELARLRMEVQPLLWEQTAGNRQFIKKQQPTLNGWGIYQCARWYDIKMRWLRLLQRAKMRRRRERAMREKERTPSPGLEDDYASPTPTTKSAWPSQPGTPRLSQEDPNPQTRRTQSYGALGLHGESQTSVRLDDEVDSDVWRNQEGSITKSEEDSHEMDLTQRIATPQRPSVPGSEVDLQQPESVTGSHENIQQPNSAKSPSQLGSKNPSRAPSNLQGPISTQGSQSQIGQSGRTPTP